MMRRAMPDQSVPAGRGPGDGVPRCRTRYGWGTGVGEFRLPEVFSRGLEPGDRTWGRIRVARRVEIPSLGSNEVEIGRNSAA